MIECITRFIAVFNTSKYISCPIHAGVFCNNLTPSTIRSSQLLHCLINCKFALKIETIESRDDLVSIQEKCQCCET